MFSPIRVAKLLVLSVSIFAAAAPLSAQDSPSPSNALPGPLPVRVVPQTMRFTGSAPNRAGDSVEMLFNIYDSPQDGEPIWSEVQRVSVDTDGKYEVLLGAATASGLPQSLFASGKARWLGVAIERAEELPRVQLASVAYAMKAADTETIAGRSLADLVTQEQLQAKLAPMARAVAAQALQAQPFTTPTGTGTADYLPLWTDASTLGNSVFFQSGKNIGIGTVTPATTLDVAGSATIEGNLQILPPYTASATAGANSRDLELTASSFSSSAAAAVAQNFVWQVSPSGNNTASPSGLLKLLYGAGSAAPTFTGLYIAPNGLITFAPGQTFPNTGNGTITGVTAGSDLTGGGTSGAVTLNLDSTKVPLLAGTNFFTGANYFHEPITFAPGQTFPGASTITSVLSNTPLTGGGSSGTVSIGLSYPALEATLNTVFAQLGASNNFTGAITDQGKAQYQFYVTTSAASANAVTGSATGNKGVGLVGTAQSFDGTGVQANGSFSLGGTGIYADGYKGMIGVGSSDYSVTFAGYPNTIQSGIGLVASGGVGIYASAIDPNNLGIGLYAVGGTSGGSNGSHAYYGTGVLGQGLIGVEGITQGSSYGVFGLAPDKGYGNVPNGNGIQGQGYFGGVFQGDCCKGPLTSGGGEGVYASGLVGLEGVGLGKSVASGQARTLGVVGLAPAYTKSTGQVTFESGAGTVLSGQFSAGVWGDLPDIATDIGDIGSAVLATADTNLAIFAANNSEGTSTLIAVNHYVWNDGPVLLAGGVSDGFQPGRQGLSSYCTIDQQANLKCDGTISNSVATTEGKNVETYSVQSAENWIEDFGSGQLTNGSAHVSLEQVFGQTVNTGMVYHVFLTPKGDCEGLYVANEGPDGFDVRELRHGASSVAFDYRIVARRKGHEQERLVDVTETHNAMVRQMRTGVRNKPAPDQSGAGNEQH